MASNLVIGKERRNELRAYVLIEASVGKQAEVAESITNLNLAEGKILFAESVTGPFDLIVQIEAEDLDTIGRLIQEGIQKVRDVRRTTTCLAVHLG